MPSSPPTSFRISKRAAPAVIGVAMRKLNRAADSRSRPANRAAEMEIPDRLMPGMSAKAWAVPSPTASGNVTSPTRRVWGPQRSATHMIAAPTRSMTATSPIPRTAVSIASLNRKPAIAAGIVAATRSQARRRSGSSANERSRSVARPAGTSRRQSSLK